MFFRARKGFGHTACIVAFACLAACRGIDSDSAGGDQASDDKPKDIDDCANDEVGAVDSDGFWVRPYKDCKADYTLHKTDSSWDTACEVSTSSTVGSADRNISCTMEANEEDLYFHGFQLQYNVPADMCYYHWFMPYYFENFRIEQGESSLIPVFIDANGNAGVDSNSDGDFADGGAETTYATNAAAAIAASDTFYVENGEVKCIYDYSTQIDGAPNCCLGSKHTRTRTFDPATNLYSAAVAFDGDWGGKAADCLAGAALEAPGVDKDADGWPLPELTYTGTDGLNKLFTTHKPIEIMGSGTMLLTNYWNPTEHTSNVPLPLRHYLPTTVSLNNHAYRYYEFRCLDRNSDLLARIRIQVRDWDEYAELKKGASSSGTLLGNPDSGFDFVTEPNFSDHYLNDFFDWKDFEDFFGDTVYPQIIKN